ncbi:PilT/PilU family type 4a pilus ATPase [Eionea flava]
MDIHKLLTAMADRSASDLFITADLPPSVKIHGELLALSSAPVSAEAAAKIVLSIMTESQRQEFKKKKELNFAIHLKGVGRFRCSAFFQRNLMGAVIRRIESKIPDMDHLGLPSSLKDMVMSKRGLLIFVGATGSGKSTSLAAMIGHRNKHAKGHIVSIEDPIEFVHEHQSSIVTQREVGIDTESFEIALQNTLRQSPDVIMIGEVRSRETMGHAISFAETGHLCLCTLHANNANQALDRILHFFPADRREQLLMDLSLNLIGIVAQQLVPSVDGDSRRACIELLLNTPLTADLIRKGEIDKLKDVMRKSTELGMQTFDHALYALYLDARISYENALAYADSKNDLRLLIKLQSQSNPRALDYAADDLELE